MKTATRIFLSYFIVFTVLPSSWAYVIAARENNWMKYAKNKYERGGGEYECRYDVQERAKVVIRKEVKNLRTDEVHEDDTPYQIVAVHVDSATGGSVIKAVGEPQEGTEELLVIGGDFVMTSASTDKVIRVADMDIKETLASETDGVAEY